MQKAVIVICEKCSEIQCLLWLLLDRCTEAANIMRRRVWSGRTLVVIPPLWVVLV
jgi:hypothetical protein